MIWQHARAAACAVLALVGLPGVLAPALAQPAAPARPLVMPRFMPIDPQALQALIDDGEAALAEGDAARARERFEQAAGLRHSADIEAGWVRAQMLAGDFRGALAFAAHVAGAHPDVAFGSALYGWLLYLGGQAEVASTVIRDAAARWPDDADVAWARQRIDAPSPKDIDAAAPRRLRPAPLGDVFDGTVRVVATGTRVDARHVLAPASVVSASADLWVRDGAGRALKARLQRVEPVTGLALLSLSPAASGGEPAPAWADRDAFPGSPAFVAGYRPGGAEAAWPSMRLGFLGPLAAGSDERLLGMQLLGVDGAEPVLDHAGRLVGVGLRGRASTAPRFVPVSAWRDGWPTEPSVGTANPTRRPPDEIYETVMRIAVQIIVVTPPNERRAGGLSLK